MSARPTLAALTALAALALILAFGLQYLGGLRPCHLCVLERYPYGLIVVVGAVALLAKRARLGLAVAALVLFNAVGLALYHVGVEQGFFTLSPGCVAGGEATTVEELRAQLMAAPPTCDQVSAAFLGLSLATWNALLALAMLAAALVALKSRLSPQADPPVKH